MCKVSMETVRRANQRTINQFRERRGNFKGVSADTFHVSVAVGGKVMLRCSKLISLFIVTQQPL